MSSNADAAESKVWGAERAKAFIDAVVAIAMTLLILPLMESVADVEDAEHTAGEWFVEHQWQLLAFVLSFFIIAMFWLNHHRMFAGVEEVSSALLWISVAWLLSIVWLPVATAMTGQFEADDPLVKVTYIGSMIVTSLLMMAQRLYLRRHPALTRDSDEEPMKGLAADLSIVTLFSLALVIALVIPSIGYWALMIMWLTGVVQRLFRRILGVSNRRR
ncbi:TMEM175 family protein [Microbacterium sp.]|uniref:TMEM175 family protein n=1 Tax=Microbacterium sp. TaxID=51671 RepID=UPI003C734557